MTKWFLVHTTGSHLKDGQKLLEGLISAIFTTGGNTSDHNALFVWDHLDWGKPTSNLSLRNGIGGGREFELKFVVRGPELPSAVSFLQSNHAFKVPLVYWHKVSVNSKFAAWYENTLGELRAHSRNRTRMSNHYHKNSRKKARPKLPRHEES